MATHSAYGNLANTGHLGPFLASTQNIHDTDARKIRCVLNGTIVRQGDTIASTIVSIAALTDYEAPLQEIR